MDATVTMVVSSCVALIGVALGVWLGARSTSNQWLKDAQLKACQRLMDEYAPLYDTLALSRRRETRDQNWAVWNQALTAVTLDVRPARDAGDAQARQTGKSTSGYRSGDDIPGTRRNDVTLKLDERFMKKLVSVMGCGWTAPSSAGEVTIAKNPRRPQPPSNT